MGRSRLLRAPSQFLLLGTFPRRNVSFSLNRFLLYFPLLYKSFFCSRGGTTPPLHLQTLEVTSPVSRHPRLHGDIRNSSVMPEHLGLPLMGRRWRGIPSWRSSQPHLDTFVSGKSIPLGTLPPSDLRWREELFHLSSSGQNRALFQFLYSLLGELFASLAIPRLLYSHPRCCDIKDKASISRERDKLI